MTNLCKYGCQHKGIKQFKNGEWCCSPSPNQCPAKIQKDKNKKASRTKKQIQEQNNKAKKTWLKKYGVENPSYCVASVKKRKSSFAKRTRSEINQSNELYKKTCLKNYGVENVSQNEAIKEKKRRTTLKNHGVEYPGQSTDIKNKIKQTNLRIRGCEYPAQNEEVQNKMKQTCLKRYGFEHAHSNPLVRQKYYNTNIERYGVKSPFCLKENRCSGTVSLMETKWLDSLNISNRQFQIENYNVDGYDPVTNTVYEFLGDFWHGNPQKYNSNDIHPLRKITYGEIYNQTLIRLEYIKQLGYNVVHIWESDWLSK